MTPDIVFNNLSDFHDAAKAAGVDYWLFEGLLLGLYRDGGPVQGDEDDTDVAIRDISEKERKRLVEELEKRGLMPAEIDGATRERNTVQGEFIGLQCARGGNRIDVCVMKHTEDWKFAYFRGGNDRNAVSYYMVFPGHHFNGFGHIKWRDKKFITVKGIEKFLEYKYRDWKTPKLRADGYDYTSTETNRSYVSEWDVTNPVLPD